MRAAIYARYSSDLQSENSIEDQVRLCLRRIEAEGWELVQTYADRAQSGASLLRPGYQHLLQDAREDVFDVVVAEALDRLSRDQEDIAGLYKQLTFADVKLVTLSEGEISELHVGLKGTMNALFLKDLADKTRRGLEGRVRQGRSGGGNSYGYNVVPSRSDQTDGNRGQREINEAEAEVVRLIFREYAAGRSPRAIAQALNEAGVLGPRGGDWGQSTINGNASRGTGILNNELYIGRLVWNRQRYIKEPSTGKRVSKLNPKDKWVVTEVPDLRILGQELWDQVKQRQASIRRDTTDTNGRNAFWDRRRPRHLLSGLLKCGVCGGGYSKISASHFGCSTARNKGTCANRLNMRRDTLEATVLNGLKHHLMKPELVKEFADAFVEEMNRLRRDELRDTEQRQRDLRQVENRISKIVNAIAEGLPARALKAELEELEDRRTELEKLLDASPDPKPILHPNLGELYQRKVAELEKLVSGPSPDAEAFGVIRGLIDEITLTPEDDRLRVDLKGDLAAILALGAKKKPAGDTGGLEQVKLVAGVGFEPTTFRL